jgi:hypothetical protein
MASKVIVNCYQSGFSSELKQSKIYFDAFKLLIFCNLLSETL